MKREKRERERERESFRFNVALGTVETKLRQDKTSLSNPFVLLALERQRSYRLLLFFFFFFYR